MNNLPEKIKAWRQARGVTQAGLAEALEVAQPTISRIESGDFELLTPVGRKLVALGIIAPGDLCSLAPGGEAK